MQYEKIELIIQSSEDGTIYDVSNLASSIKTSKPIDSSAGKCSFSIDTNVKKLSFPMGSTVSFSVMERGVKRVNSLVIYFNQLLKRIQLK